MISLPEQAGQQDADGGLVSSVTHADAAGGNPGTPLDRRLGDWADARLCQGTRQPGADHGVSDEGFSVEGMEITGL